MSQGLQSDLRFAPAKVDIEKRADGSLLLRSPMALGACARCVTEWLVDWAGRAPERVFVAERASTGWRTQTYGETLAAVRAIGQGLLERGLSAAHPVAILSDNSVDHALLALGAQHVGVPIVPISPAYSLMSKDFAKLKYIFELVRPALVWTADPEKFAPALAAVGAHATPLDALRAAQPGAQVEAAHARVGPDTVAKILFTSGSTGQPKGVINTQRMLTANQQMLAQGWPFVEARPPVVVDWLPWNHTFGGNHNFNLVLRNGGTLYVDAGKPMPGLIETTAKNLAEIAPTMYFNVPRGFDLLLPFLERDAALRKNFFRELDMVFYAAAALPQNLWERLERLAVAEKGGRLAMLSAWGSTETAPLATQVHFPIPTAGVIGLPVAGCMLNLGGQARSPREGAERDAGLLPARRPDPGGIRRGRLLPHRRRGEVRRSGGAGKGHCVRRSGRGGLQAQHRDLGQRGRDPRAPDRGLQPDRAGRRDHRARSRRSRRAGVPQSGGAGHDARGDPWQARPGSAVPGVRRRRQLDPADAAAGAERAAIDRCKRDYRQGLHQPARGTGPAVRARRAPVCGR
jgi:acyl-coenzyme A synthetase/AMP-(fatty) acid ligase